MKDDKLIADGYKMWRAEKPNWDKWWSQKFEKFEFINKIWYSILWKAYSKLLTDLHIDSDFQVLELGCGSGRISLMMAKKYSCKVTLIDGCKSAIIQAKKSFKRQGIHADFIWGNIFNEKVGEFDLVHSEGLIEHFKPQERKKIVFIHRNATKPGGHVIIFTPTNSFCYKLTRQIMVATKNWYFGHENPIQLNELIDLYEEMGLRAIKHTSVLFSREVGLLGKRENC